MIQARAFAPATVANVAVGFDILGFALEGIGEIATVEKIMGPAQVLMNPVKNFPEISTYPEKNTATAGLLKLMHDKKLDFGFRVTLEKSIPIGSGLGGSSTSAVAALVAANALLRKKLSARELLEYALVGEAIASGAKHGDNVAPCLHGGLVFVRGGNPWRTVKINTPPSLRCVILLPQLSIKTKEARSMLQAEIPMRTMIEQTANLAGLILGCQKGDFALIRECLRDVVVEPQRASLITGFYDFQKCAMMAGALGCSISGSGPALFAWAESSAKAKRIEKDWLVLAAARKIRIVRSLVSPIQKKGAYLLGVKK